MQYFKNLFVTFITLTVISSCGKSKLKSITVNEDSSELIKRSYSMGYDYGKNLVRMGINEFDYDGIIQGLLDGLKEEAQLSEEEMIRVLTQLNKEMMERRQKEALSQDSGRKAESDKNTAEGDAFLRENKDKPEVKTTASGLQYKVLKEGSGKSPVATDNVRVHYEGRLLNGEVFDSSYKRGEPAEFPLNGVIRGWTEGVQLMKEGAVFEFYIPSNLAYGASGAGAKIGSNATLIFKVELLEVK